MSVNHLKITIPDEVLDEREETDKELNNQKKRAKKTFAWEILKNVCALHNSNGGTLELFSAQELNPDNLVRLAEELSQNVFNTAAILKIFKIYKQTPNSLTFKIQGSPSLITMRYNIFLPTETQVLEVRQVEFNSKQQVREIIDRNIFELNHDEVPADFICGNSSGLRESQTIQFKNLKTEATKKVTFADRVIKNKFTHYVSAFANHRGGRIYYGIKDDGVVAGEKLSDEEKVRVEKRIEKVIGEMRCHGASGVEWDITFASVKDNADHQIIESIFVMIVYISPFFGGVFTEEPESYRIEKEKVVKISFNDWFVQFKMERQSRSITVRSQHVSNCVKWSSPGNRKIYLYFTIGLVECRNDNDMKKFKIWQVLAVKRYTGTDASLIIMLENVAVYYKKLELEKASTLLEKISNGNLLRRSLDKKFHLAKVLYLRSRIKRAQKQYEESYKLAGRCLQIVTDLPAEFITVWCYMQLAMLANILGASQNDSTKFSEAQQWLQVALRDACTLNEFPTGLLDVQQKFFIYQAMTLLKCSLIGGISDLDVSSEDINAAVQELTKLYNSFMKGNHMSQYREIQYLFAQCSLFLRHSEHTKSRLKRRQFLKRAGKWAKQAKDLANECSFKDMQDYATSFQEVVDHRMYFPAIETRGPQSEHVGTSVSNWNNLEQQLTSLN